MAIVRVPEEQRTIDEPAAITAFLAERGIDYEQWTSEPSAPDTTAEHVRARERGSARSRP